MQLTPETTARIEIPVYTRLTICVNERCSCEKIKKELARTLKARFSRQNSLKPGQGLSLSAVIETAMTVKGVESVHVKSFTSDEKLEDQKIVENEITAKPNEVVRLARADFTVAFAGTKISQ